MNVQLYLGDCLDFMRTLPAGSVDIVLTSPPYNVGLQYSVYHDELPQQEFVDFNKKWITEAYRVMNEGARMYVVVSDKMLLWLPGIAQDIGLKFCQILTWCKPNLAGAGSISGDWNYLTEQIILFRKGKRTAMLSGNGTNTHSYFVIPSPQRNWNEEEKKHPAQFPLALPSRILSRTPGNVVMDPFLGSGSVGVACVKFDRSFIGCEIDPGYFAIAEKRIKAAQQQPRLEGI